MARTTQVQTNFTAGELSPRLFGRSDLKKYNNGASKLENFLVQTHGGIERRPGTIFVREANGTVVTTSEPRLVEFEYNVEQSYVLEFGVTTTGSGDNGYIRFFRLDANGDPAILIDTTAGSNPTIISALAFRDTELQDLQFTQSADTLYVFSATRPIYKLERTGTDDSDADNWSYTKHIVEDGPYQAINADETLTLDPTQATVGTGVTVTASSALFASTDVGRLIRFGQPTTSYDILEITPGSTETDPAEVKIDDDGAVRNLAGTGGGEGIKLDFFDITKGVTELNDTINIGRNFVDDGGDSKFDLWHASNIVEISLFDLPSDPHQNGDGKVRVKTAIQWGWAEITGFTSSTSVTVTIKTELPTALATDNWQLGAWSDTTGYPKTGRFFQDRLWGANTTSEPQTVWSSETGAYSCFSPSTRDKALVLDTSAITVTLADSQVNSINYLAGDTNGLLILTAGGEWLGKASSQSEAITPTDIGFNKQSYYGSSADATPARAGSAILFVQRDGRVLRELVYEFGQDRFVAADLTLLSEHITGTGIKDTAYQQGRSNRFWAVRKDGVLLTMTYERAEEVIAWHEQPLAKSNNTAATVISVATTRDTNTDNIWILVKRDINGTDRYYIEMIDQPLEATDNHDTAFYVDSGLKGFDATPQTVWSGLDHLDGETVIALGDAVTYTGLTVSSGSITLPTAVNRVAIGLKYSSVMETMPLQVPEQVQLHRGKLKRAYKNYINLYRTLGGKVGTPDQVYPIEYPTSTATTLNTKMFEVSTPDNSARETVLRYEQEDAQPANILSQVTEFNAGGV